MSRINKFRKFEIITGAIALVFMVLVPIAEALIMAKVIWPATSTLQMVARVFIMIGCGAVAILSILSCIYIAVKTLKSTLKITDSTFLGALCLIFSWVVPGVLYFVAKRLVNSPNESNGKSMLESDYDDEKKESDEDVSDTSAKKKQRTNHVLSEMIENA